MSATFAGICPQKVEHEPHLLVVTLEWTCMGKLIIWHNFNTNDKIAECGGHTEHSPHIETSKMDLVCKGTNL